MGIFEEIKEKFYGKGAPPQLRLAPKEKEYWRSAPLLYRQMVTEIDKTKEYKDDPKKVIGQKREIDKIVKAFEKLAGECLGSSLRVNEDIQQSAPLFKGIVEVFNAYINPKASNKELFLTRLKYFLGRFEKKAKVSEA